MNARRLGILVDDSRPFLRLPRCSLQILDFDGGVEIRVRGRDKGSAVRAILEECGSNAAVAYLGDDFTDEDAFHALRGRGLTALVREQPRETFADIQLRPPQELIHFLEDWRNTAGGGQD